MALPRATLLKVPNYHRTMDGGTCHPPTIPDQDDAFVAYMPNEYGEQMVYVHERGKAPLLYHGDYGWHPIEVPAEPVAELKEYGDLSWLNVGGLVVHDAEALFVAACRKASRLFDREPVA